MNLSEHTVDKEPFFDMNMEENTNYKINHFFYNLCNVFCYVNFRK